MPSVAGPPLCLLPLPQASDVHGASSRRASESRTAAARVCVPELRPPRGGAAPRSKVAKK